MRGSSNRYIRYTDAVIVELNGYLNLQQRQPKKTFTLLIATLLELCKRSVIPGAAYCQFPPSFRVTLAVLKLVFIHASRTPLARKCSLATTNHSLVHLFLIISAMSNIYNPVYPPMKYFFFPFNVTRQNFLSS